MDNQLEARQPGSPTHWGEEDVATALHVLALNGGDCTRAREILTAEGRPIPLKTLLDWKNNIHAVRYEETVYNLRKEIGSVVSDRAMANATAANNLQAEMLAKAAETLAIDPPKDLTKAALNLALVQKNNVETARILRDQPTSIVEVRNVDETIADLADLGIITVEAEELDNE